MLLSLAPTMPRPLIHLAPMSGITDAPFRAAVRAFGVGTLVSEMVASGAMIEQMRDTRKLREVFDPAAPTVLQLAGFDPALVAQAAEIACDRGAVALDLNFGCPARKVTGKAAGSALMREPETSARIFAAVGEVMARYPHIPWSVKMRLGWDWDCLNAPDLARLAVGEGASQITVHGRTRCQFYKGQADWRAVARVVEAVPVPVIVNGDIHTATHAREALRQSGAAGFMVGRATTGRPWLLKEIASDHEWQPAEEAQRASLSQLLEDTLSFYGTVTGLKNFRKHLAAWLPSGSPHKTLPSDAPREVLKSDDPAQVFAALGQATLRAAA